MLEFTLDYKKIKNLYAVKNDNTSIDNFTIKFMEEFKSIILEYCVKGISAGENKFIFKQLPYNFVQHPFIWESNQINNFVTREYYLKVYFDYKKIPMKLCNFNWVDYVELNLISGSETDFIENIEIANNAIKEFLKNNCLGYRLSVFCGTIPGSSWKNRNYIKLIINLPISSLDLFTQAGISNLTDFGQNYRDIIKNEFIKIVENKSLDIITLFNNKIQRERIVRLAENEIRKQYGLKNVGDTFVNETLLANITKTYFPDTIRQYNPKWAGRFLIDIYIPSLNFAIEYQGKQHYEPINIFGGEESLKRQKLRDKFIREKCEEFKIKLLEWHYSIPVTEHNVLLQYSKFIDIENYKRPLTLFD